MRIELQPAYILHTRPFRDTSLIIDCFSRDYGRVSLLAKGARSAKSRQRQLLQPFTPLLLSWQGKGDLKTLVGVETEGQGLFLQGKVLFSGLYINEVLVRLLPQMDAHPDILFLYQQVLARLEQVNQGETDLLEPSLRQFEFSLLEALGYGIDFHSDCQGQPLQPEGWYQLYPERGFLSVQPNPDEVSFQGACLKAIGEGDFSSLVNLRTAKQLARVALKPYLGSKPLQSRMLFASQPLS
ncbi:DNA repair protein RecO [Maricurvus nonylphenolicus]|uniref:DNA repair protein RecO n=1 Tax=Maricurvus nonylphenolicus TaxID=1008307 RepID=UPI0036F3C10F